MVGDEQSLAAQEGGADPLELGEIHFSRRHGEDAHPPAHFLGRVVGRAHEAVQAGHQGLHVGTEQAALIEAGEQMLHGQQGVDFPGVEPETGQFELPAGVRVAGRGSSGIAVAACRTVPDDGGIEAVAQIQQVALERGA